VLLKKGGISYLKSIPRDKLELEYDELLAKIKPCEDAVASAKAIPRDMWQQQKTLKVERRKRF
jgi:hypothetical protein